MAEGQLGAASGEASAPAGVLRTRGAYVNLDRVIGLCCRQLGLEKRCHALIVLLLSMPRQVIGVLPWRTLRVTSTESACPAFCDNSGTLGKGQSTNVVTL